MKSWWFVVLHSHALLKNKPCTSTVLHSLGDQGARDNALHQVCSLGELDGSIKNIRHPFNEVLPPKSGQIMANPALKEAAPHFPWQLPSASEQEMVIGTKRHERWASPTPRLRRGRKLNEWNLNAPMRLTARLQTRQRIANMRFKVEVICHRSNLEDYTIAYPQPRGVQPPWPEKLPLGLTCWVSDHRQTSYERMLYPLNTKSNIKKPCLGRSLAFQQGIQKVSNSLRCTAVPYFIRQ